MLKPYVIQRLTAMGIDFEKESNFEGEMLGKDKYYLYRNTVENMLLETGIPNTFHYRDFIDRVAIETAYRFVQEYNRLLARNRPSPETPLSEVKVNMMDIICYAEIVALEVYDEVQAFIAAHHVGPNVYQPTEEDIQLSILGNQPGVKLPIRYNPAVKEKHIADTEQGTCRVSPGAE